MANNIATILTFKGTNNQIAEVMDFIRGEDTLIDFDKIVPMPGIFKRFDTTNHPNGKGLEVGYPVDPFEKDSPIVTPELLEDYKRATAAQARFYGVIGWYDWRLKNWGTKWGAYESSEESENSIYFETAWSFAAPVVLALSRRFPDVEICFIYADEDAGYNTGRGIAKGGVFSEFERPEGGSDEGMELYFATHLYDEGNWEKGEDGEWHYIDR